MKYYTNKFLKIAHSRYEECEDTFIVNVGWGHSYLYHSMRCPTTYGKHCNNCKSKPKIFKYSVSCINLASTWARDPQSTKTDIYTLELNKHTVYKFIEFANKLPPNLMFRLIKSRGIQSYNKLSSKKIDKLLKGNAPDVCIAKYTAMFKYKPEGISNLPLLIERDRINSLITNPALTS